MYRVPLVPMWGGGVVLFINLLFISIDNETFLRKKNGDVGHLCRCTDANDVGLLRLR